MRERLCEWDGESVLEQEGVHEKVAAAVAREHNLVLLDGGSKMLEVSRFGPLLAQNSVFVIHDWEDETFEAGFERALDDMVPCLAISLPPSLSPSLPSFGLLQSAAERKYLLGCPQLARSSAMTLTSCATGL